MQGSTKKIPAKEEKNKLCGCKDFNRRGGVWPPCPGREISREILTVIGDHFSVSQPLPSASQPASHAGLDIHHQWFKSGKTDFMFYGEIECLFALFALATYYSPTVSHFIQHKSFTYTKSR